MTRIGKKLNKLLALMLCTAMALSVCLLGANAAPGLELNGEEYKIGAEAVILMDADSGQILYGKSQDKRMHPAGMTKIMTSILAIESITDHTQMLPVTGTMLAPLSGTSGRALSPMLVSGETISVADCLYGTLLISSNDTANVLAETVGTTLEDFYAMMNAKAVEVGARDTNFKNASGLHDDAHYTTAYDMAMILRYALKNPGFMTYFNATTHTIAPTNRCTAERNLKTRFEMRTSSNYTYEYAIGGITGVTSSSGITFAAAAQKDGRTLIAIVLKASTNPGGYSDLKALFEYGFNQFREVTVDPTAFGSTTSTLTSDSVKVGTVTFTAAAPVTVLLRNDVEVADIVCSSVDIPSAIEETTDISGYVGKMHFVEADGTIVELASNIALSATKTYDEPIVSTDDPAQTTAPGQSDGTTDGGNVEPGDGTTAPSASSGSSKGVGKKVANFFKVFLIVILIIVGIIVALALLFIATIFIIRAVRRKKRRAARERARQQQNNNRQ